MKNPKAYSLVEVLIAFVIAAMFSAMISMAVLHAKKERAIEDRVRAVETECVHQWAKWTEPVTSSDWYYGTRMFQSRTCEKCGLAETRRTQIAPGK